MTQEYYARVNYVYDGDTSTFSIPFSYIDPSHVVVIINGDTDNPITNITFNTVSQITFDVSGLVTGDRITICRTTPLNDRFVEFTDGNILDEETQNLSAEQVFNAVQEVTDYNDELISNMAEFVELKGYIDSVLTDVDDAIDNIKTATEYYQSVQQLVNDISASYEEVQQQIADGLRTNTTRNLFELVLSDKVLTDTEALGLAIQGSTLNEEDYPDAYQSLLNEYNNGTSETYIDEDISTYYKGYTGETTGKFYIASTDDLVEDTVVYAPIFDETKYKTVGSPTSSNGVITNVSSANYFYQNNITISADDNIEFYSPLFMMPSSVVTVGTQTVFSFFVDSDVSFQTRLNNNVLFILWKDNDGNDIIRSTDVSYSRNVYYQVKGVRKNGVYKIYLRQVGGDEILLGTAENKTFSGTFKLQIGVSLSTQTYPNTDGYIDLKENVIIINDNVILSGKPDINLIDDIGALASDAETFTVHKYTDEDGTDFYTLDSLAEDVTVYSNEACTTTLGTITDLVDVTVNKFTFSSTGAVYVPASESLDVGTILYSDKTLLTPIGYISAVKPVSSVKYSITGLNGYEYFYVPSGTEIQANTIIYSDAACTNIIGTVSSKGTISTPSSYFYSFKEALGNDKPKLYTKDPISSSAQKLYEDVTCLVPSVSGGYQWYVKLKSKYAYIYNQKREGYYTYKLISKQVGGVSSYYIIMNDVQYPYFRVSEVEDTAYQINSGSNESFILNETKNYKSIKIGSGSYKTYSTIGDINILTVKILYTGESTATVEKAVYDGLEVTAGVLFEYKQASNGHKIVNGIYKPIVTSLEANPYYVIDIDKKQFTLPSPFTGETIVYYSIGNTVTVQSNILGVTQAQLTAALSDYIKSDNEQLAIILNVIKQYDDTVGNIDSALGEIIGE